MEWCCSHSSHSSHCSHMSCCHTPSRSKVPILAPSRPICSRLESNKASSTGLKLELATEYRIATIYLSIHPSIYPSIYHYLSIYSSIYQSIYLSIYLFIYRSIYHYIEECKRSDLHNHHQISTTFIRDAENMLHAYLLYSTHLDFRTCSSRKPCLVVQMALIHYH